MRRARLGIAGDYSHLQRIIDRCGRRALLIPAECSSAAHCAGCSEQQIVQWQTAVPYEHCAVLHRLQCKYW